MRYPIPNLPRHQQHVTELEIEKSRFLTWVGHTPRVADFDKLLLSARSRYPDASHHCSAFVAGPPGEQTAIGFSDDGEPGGTAGRPMFQVLNGTGIGQIGCVVTRYFGGIKLGTGGLARAYAQAVQQALETLPLQDFTERRPVCLRVDFAGEAEARAWLLDMDIPIDASDYDAQGVILNIAWPLDTPLDLASLEARLKGRISLIDRQDGP